MADSSKRKRTAQAVPPWHNRENELQPRRHTTTTSAPARPTGSNRHIRHIPTKPSGARALRATDMYSKKRTSAKFKPKQSTTPLQDPPAAQYSPIQKPKAPQKSIQKPKAPQKSKAPASLKPHHPPQPPGSRTQSFHMHPSSAPSIKRGSSFEDEPDLHKSQTVDAARWKNHPHAIYDPGYHTHIHDADDVKAASPKTKKTMKQVPKRAQPQVEEENDIALMYSKNIAKFDNKTLTEIDKCNIESLLSCMHEGSMCLKDFQSALTTFAKQQQTQCANFLKLFKKSKSRYAQMDAMPNFFYAIRLIHSLLEETVKQSSQFAKFIQVSCLPMIHELEYQCDEKYKEINGITKTADKRLHDLRHEVLKTRKQTKSAAEKVLVARQKNEAYIQENKFRKHEKSHSKMSIISNISDILQTGTNTECNLEDAYNLAKEHERRCKMAITEYNAARVEYIKGRNTGKHEIINMEHFRVDSMLSVLQKIVQQQRKETPLKEEERVKCTLYQLQDDVLKHAESVTAKSVVGKFVHVNVETHGSWKPPQPMEWNLDIEYRDMFHSIEDAMNITLDINPNVKIPLIVPLLCEKIKELNGFKEEGIFRKSPNRSKMLKLKKRLRGKNFQLKENSVHIYAALLKDWLRHLKDLLIPKRYYDYCVSMAKEGKLNKEQFEVFFSQLPHVNRETLKYLIKFLRDLLDPQNKPFSKMGLENIAIVFGPTLLMPPHDLEPTVAMLNAKSEKDFVISLIQNS